MSKSPHRSRSKRSLFTVGAIVVAASLALVGCSTGSPSSTSAASKTLVIVTPDQGVSWAIDAAYSGGDLNINTQATLIRKPYEKSKASKADEQNIYKFEGYLAKSYSVSPDGLTYTFNLNHGVKSAAGNELTSADVLWSYQRKFNTPTAITPALSKPAITDPTKQIKATGKYTVTFTIANKSSGFTLLALLSDVTGQIYDSTLLKKHVTTKDPWAVTWSAQHPNYGFGPYTVQSYKAGVQTVLVANKNFVLGEPKIHKIISRVIADPGQRANAVKSGQAQIAENLEQSDLHDLSSQSSVFVPTVDYPNQLVSFAMVTNKAPFNNVLVRQALSYAIPYNDIVKNVFYGRAVTKNASVFRADTPGYSAAGNTVYDYDIAKAKSLLKQAGLSSVSFTLTVSAANPSTQNTATQIQTSAKAAGFNVNIKTLPATAFQQGELSHTYQSSMTVDYAVTLSPPYELGLYTTPNDANNRADWTSPAFEAALNKGIAAGDPLSAAAGKYWEQAMAIYTSQVPINYIASPQPDTALASNLEGYAWRTDATIDYSALYFK
jgi:peptide/nickel transport system substrate-binding protein